MALTAEIPIIQKYQQETFPELTALRGIGAIWVTLFHLFPHSSSYLINCGYLGVDLFFILSGFIISHVHCRDFTNYSLHSHVRFLKLRLARIYPLHVIVLCLFALFVIYSDSFVTRYSAGKFSFANFFSSLFLVHTWGFDPITLWNTPTWSLSAEWLAYLLFPYISMMCLRFVGVRWAVISAIIAISVMAVTLSWGGHADFNGLGKAGLVRMAGGFIAGCMIQRKAANVNKTSRIFTLLAGIFIFSAIAFKPLLFLYFYGFIFLILALIHEKSFINDILCIKQILFLGEISFSIYLCHWPLIQVRNWIGDQYPAYNVFSWMVLTVALLYFPYLCWRFIEKPSRSLGRRWAQAS